MGVRLLWDVMYAPFVDPLVDRPEEQLVATVRILFPPSQFVVHGQRDTFFEALASPCGKSNDVAVRLQLERHFEILGDVVLGPELLVSVLIEVANLLDGGPAEDGVVTDEGGDVTVADGVLDGRVDQVGEESLARGCQCLIRGV